jgi:hypothetical protein
MLLIQIMKQEAGDALGHSENVGNGSDCFVGKEDNYENDEECVFHLSDDYKRGKSLFPRRVSQKNHEYEQIWDAMCVALNRILPIWSNNNAASLYEDPYSNLQLRKALGGDYTLLSDVPHLDSLKIPKIVLQIHYIYSHGHCNYTVEVLDESITKPEIGWLSQDLIRNHPEWIRAGTVFLCSNVSLAVFHNERHVNKSGYNGSEYDGRNGPRRRTVETFDRMLVLGEDNVVFAWTKQNIGDVSHEEYLHLLEKRSEVEQELMIMVGKDDLDQDAEVVDLQEEEDHEEDSEETLGKENLCHNTNMPRDASVGFDNPYKSVQTQEASNLDPWCIIRDKSFSSTRQIGRIPEVQGKLTVDNHQGKGVEVGGRRASLPMSSSHDHVPHSSAGATATIAAHTPQHLPLSIRHDVNEATHRPMVPELPDMGRHGKLNHPGHVVHRGLDKPSFQPCEKEKSTATATTTTTTTTIQNPYVTNKSRSTQKSIHPDRGNFRNTVNTASVQQEKVSRLAIVQSKDSITSNDPNHTNQGRPNKTNRLEHTDHGEISTFSFNSTNKRILNQVSSTRLEESTLERKDTENLHRQSQQNSIWTNIQQHPMDMNVFHEEFNDNNTTNDNVFETIVGNNFNKTILAENNGRVCPKSSLENTCYDKTTKDDTVVDNQQLKTKFFTLIEEGELDAFDED